MIIFNLNFLDDPRFVKSRNQMQAIAANSILLNGQMPQIGHIPVNPMHQPYNIFPNNNQINNNQMNNNQMKNNNNDEYYYDDDEYYYDDEEYEEEKKKKKKEEKKSAATTKKADTIKKLRRPSNSTKTKKDNINMLHLPRNSRPNPIIDTVPKEKDVKLQLIDRNSRERLGDQVSVRPISRTAPVWGTLTIISNNNNNVNINEDRLSMDELYELLNRRNNRLSRVDLLDYNKKKLEQSKIYLDYIFMYSII